MEKNSLEQLAELGQSPWLDNIKRGDLKSGQMQKLIKDGILGVTANPTIFEKAISGSEDYDEGVEALVRQGKSAEEIYKILIVEDITTAADIFRPVYDRTEGVDGYISIEVAPSLAHDTEGTLKEALDFHQIIGRPNIFVKVPATAEGIPAIEELLYRGVNVNITLIFGVDVHRQVMEAYLKALERRVEEGKPVDRIGSVASFFVSRVDTKADKALEDKLKEEKDPERQEMIRGLLGTTAINNSKMAYQEFREVFGGERFARLKEKGARAQRPLWASTSTKNPEYRDVIYVEELIGPDTVNTMPPQTIEAFKDHGVAKCTIDQDLDLARQQLRQLEELGISLDRITEELTVEGVASFSKSFDSLDQVLRDKREQVLAQHMGDGKAKEVEGKLEQRDDAKAQGKDGKDKASLTEGAEEVVGAGSGGSSGSGGGPALGPGTYADAHVEKGTASLGGLEPQVRADLRQLAQEHAAEKIWKHDPTFWKSDPEAQKKIGNRLGWIGSVALMREQAGNLRTFADEVRKAGYQSVVLLGMGGSSLAPEVINRVFGVKDEYPRFFMLDSTEPGTIEAIERRIDPAKTLFIVATKSGGTTETISFYRYFREKVEAAKREKAGENFVAITDPGSSLEKLAGEEGFRRTFLNMADIGGRYSALSYFGVLPAALMGVDIEALLQSAERMHDASAPSEDKEENPGLWLGTVMGEAWKAGRDKLTITTSPDLDSFGLWAEQLIAESTGKEEKGLIPVTGEPLGRPSAYGNDRLFIYLYLEGATDAEQEHALQKLEDDGQPVVRLKMAAKADLGAEFFRWELATAVAGHILQIDPFDEPNVQESKDNTARLLGIYQGQGRFPEQEPLAQDDGLALYGDGEALGRAGSEGTLGSALNAFFRTVEPGDYVALLAYMPSTGEHEALLQDARLAIRDGLRVATTFGYGPRFLHSTGQLHKGGPNKGVYVQITVHPQRDLEIPGSPYSFGTLIRAQSMGDLQSLQEHGRRAIRLHITGDHAEGVEHVREAIKRAVSGLGI